MCQESNTAAMEVKKSVMMKMKMME